MTTPIYSRRRETRKARPVDDVRFHQLVAHYLRAGYHIVEARAGARSMLRILDQRGHFANAGDRRG